MFYNEVRKIKRFPLVILFKIGVRIRILGLNYLLTLGSEINVSKLTLRLKGFRMSSTTLLMLKIINKLMQIILFT